MITGKTGSLFWSARDWSTGSKIIASCKRSKFKNKLMRLKTCKQRCLNARRLKQVRVHSSAAGSEAPGAAALLWGKQLPRGRERGTWAGHGWLPGHFGKGRKGKAGGEGTAAAPGVCRGANAKSLQGL